MSRIFKHGTVLGLLTALAAVPLAAGAAQLSEDARASIPRDVQQIIVVDYRAMQNSPAAMQLKDRVLPPELKRLETSLKTSGLQVDQDADTLAFAAFHAPGSDNTRILGVAQGQFDYQAILAHFTKLKTKPIMLRNNPIYPMGVAGMSVAFLNQTTMIFGDRDAVKAAPYAELPAERRHDERYEPGGQPPGLEPSGPEGHADHDEERAG